MRLHGRWRPCQVLIIGSLSFSSLDLRGRACASALFLFFVQALFLISPSPPLRLWQTHSIVMATLVASPLAVYLRVSCLDSFGLKGEHRAPVRFRVKLTTCHALRLKYNEIYSKSRREIWMSKIVAVLLLVDLLSTILAAYSAYFFGVKHWGDLTGESPVSAVRHRSRLTLVIRQLSSTCPSPSV